MAVQTKKAPLAASGHKRKRRKHTAAAPKRRRKHHHAAPARKRRVSAGGGGFLKPLIKTSMYGGLGGAVMEGVDMISEHLHKGKPKKSHLIHYGLGGLAIFGMATMRMPFMAAGAAGAMGKDLTAHLLGRHKGLHDNLEDHDYVDPNTLMETGLSDEMGEIGMDEAGNLYGLNEAGQYEHIGHLEDLPEDMADELADSLEDYHNVQSASLQTLNPGHYNY